MTQFYKYIDKSEGRYLEAGIGGNRHSLSLLDCVAKNLDNPGRMDVFKNIRETR
jgi:hypothetical protein